MAAPGRRGFLILSVLLFRQKCVFSFQSMRLGGMEQMNTLPQRLAVPAKKRDYIDCDSPHWVDMFSLLIEYKDREGHCEVPYCCHEENEWKELGVWLSKQREAYKLGRLSPVDQQRLEEAGVLAWDQDTRKWEHMLDRLLQFKEREGHCLVPSNYIEDGESLGRWLVTQRQLKRTGKLGSRRIQILEEAGVAWQQYYGIKWNQIFKLLLQYKDREGHTQVPRNHQEEGQNLGAWLKTQRGEKRRGALKLDRQDRLEKAGVVLDPITHPWESMLDRLLQFQRREGYCSVPHNHIEDGARLGKWLVRQRQWKRTGKLESRRIHILEEAGVAWHSQDGQWNEMFKLLLQYKDREGHTQVPQTHQEEGQNLGNWLSLQRVVKRRGALELDRQDRLEKAGVVFDPFTHQWESMLDRLLQFQQREGHCLVPHNHIEDGARLGRWLSEQRRLKRTGKLGSRRIQILEEAGVAWHSQDGQWNQMFKLLLQYKDREGHTQVPHNHQEEGQNLGALLNRQRGAKRRGALKLDRQDRLEKAGVVWDVQRLEVRD